MQAESQYFVDLGYGILSDGLFGHGGALAEKEVLEVDAKVAFGFGEVARAAGGYQFEDGVEPDSFLGEPLDDEEAELEALIVVPMSEAKLT